MKPINESSQTMRISILPEDQAPATAEKTPAPTTRKTPRPVVVSRHATDNSQFNELFQSVYDAALLCDLEGKIVDVNVRASDFFLYDKADFCRLGIKDIVSGFDDSLLQTIGENLKVDRFTLIEAYCRRSNGSFFPTEIAVNKLSLSQNGLLCFFIRDITVRKQTEQEITEKNKQLQLYATKMESLAEERAKQLVHADRLVRLGVMSAGIAHEVNNPTVFISSNAEMMSKFWAELEPALRQCPETDEKRRQKHAFILEEFPKVLSGIRMGVDRIQHIVKGLKSFSYQGQGAVEKAPCDPNLCVTQALEMFRNALKKFITVETRLGENLPKILGDSQQLVQVLVNLFANAADAMEAQGEGVLTIRTLVNEERVRIEVDDTGPGIPTDKLVNIWEPFFTTKAKGKGTGLGLSISHSIITAHNGTLEAENKPEGGARFVIELPACIPVS
ncbi:MAG: PAS domain S-box protein [Lentisphaerae bacterium]|nr:PAS domain S-box protein [Lentisphaerota bacterium]